MRHEKIRALAIMLAASLAVVVMCGPVYDQVKAKNRMEMAAAAGSGQSRQALADTADGIYEGSAQGFGGEVKVRVQVAEQAIVNIEVDAATETAEIGGAAAPKLAERILESQSLQVDAVSGASMTSAGVLGAVEQALADAGADVELLKSVEVVKNGVDEELTTQIVVVGGGASGTAAALEVAEAGAQVIVVEMTSSPAGQGTMAGGLFATDSAQQKESGQTVDPK